MVKKQGYRIVCVVLCCLIGFFIAVGCGNHQERQEGEKYIAEANVQALDYPQKDITLIIPFTAGGFSDVQARIVEKYFKEEFGVNLIFMYKEGAGGEIGFTELANAKPDGYTIGGLNSPHILLQPLARDTQFTYKSFDYIGVMVNDPQVIAVSADSQYSTLEELLDACRKNPGSLTAAISGSYSGDHITALKLMEAAQCEFQVVPYNGSADQLVALQGGHVNFMVGNLNDVNRDLDKYKLLAITTKERHPMAPNVPTLLEQGYDVTNGITRMFGTPAGVDPQILERLRQGFERIAANPDYLSDMEKVGQPEGWLNGSDVPEQLEQDNIQLEELLQKYGLLKEQIKDK